MLDLDGFVKLSDAGIREAEAHADIVGKMVEAEIKWQQAVHAALENLAKLLDIQWDAQAHKQLIRMRNVKLRNAKLAKTEAEHLSQAVMWVNKLMSGDVSLTAVTSGWMSFGFIRSRVALGGAILPVPDDKFVYDRELSWAHPDGGGSTVAPGRDPGAVLRWARINNFYPIAGGPAWLWLTGYLAKLSAVAAAEAEKIDKRVEVAENAALELERRDWDRLKDKP